MDIVLTRRRKHTKRQERTPIICQFVGTGCDFMKERDTGTFRNVTDLKYVSFNIVPSI